ncbi:MAG: DMT family transporter [Negativicutes bacterium]|nr:DMT family transporter [Negativicutes bacterium]
MDVGNRIKTRYAQLILFLLIVVWGINIPVMKIGLTAMSPTVYNAFRLVIAAVISLAALLLTKSYRPMPAKDVRLIVSVSVLGFFLNQVFITFGIPQTTAGNASLVLATLPVVVALINRVLGLERISRQVALAIVVSLVGVVLIVLGSNKEFSLAGPHMVGACLVLLSQVGYGYYTVFFKRLVSTYSIYQIIASVMTINAVLFCLISLPDLAQTRVADISTAAWYSIVFSGLFGLSLGNFVWVWVVGTLGSTRASVYTNLCPVFAIAFAWFYLDESFGLLQAAGAAVIFWGVYLTHNQADRSPTSVSL